MGYQLCSLGTMHVYVISRPRSICEEELGKGLKEQQICTNTIRLFALDFYG